jgi:hypothetical protein
MGNRKLPRPVPRDQVKPTPSPPPPPRTTRLVVTIRSAKCSLVCSEEIRCPACQLLVPPNVKHECEVDGPIRVVRNLLNAQTR